MCPTIIRGVTHDESYFWIIGTDTMLMRRALDILWRNYGKTIICLLSELPDLRNIHRIAGVIQIPSTIPALWIAPYECPAPHLLLSDLIRWGRGWGVGGD